MSPAAEQRMVMQILMAYGLPGDLEPHIPDLAALMQIDVTHGAYIDQELSMYVAAAASEAITARCMSIRNEAEACLAMARNAVRVPSLGPPPAAQATAHQGAAPLGAAMPIAAHKSLVQASGLRAQPIRQAPGKQAPINQPGMDGAPRQKLTQVEIEDADKKALVSVLMAEMPAAWRASHYARVPINWCPFMWPGMDATATEADAYTGKPATHAVEAARDMRNILTDWSRACGTTRQSGLHRSHDGRHVIPEGARVMKLPRWSMRDTIGLLALFSAVTDETVADAARTAALHVNVHVIPECARVMTSSPVHARHDWLSAFTERRRGRNRRGCGARRGPTFRARCPRPHGLGQVPERQVLITGRASDRRRREQGRLPHGHQSLGRHPATGRDSSQQPGSATGLRGRGDKGRARARGGDVRRQRQGTVAD